MTGIKENITCTCYKLSNGYCFIMCSTNVVIIPVDGSKNSDRAVDCKSVVRYLTPVTETCAHKS